MHFLTADDARQFQQVTQSLRLSLQARDMQIVPPPMQGGFDSNQLRERCGRHTCHVRKIDNDFW